MRLRRPGPFKGGIKPLTSADALRRRRQRDRGASTDAAVVRVLELALLPRGADFASAQQLKRASCNPATSTVEGQMVFPARSANSQQASHCREERVATRAAKHSAAISRSRDFRHASRGVVRNPLFELGFAADVNKGHLHPSPTWQWLLDSPIPQAFGRSIISHNLKVSCRKETAGSSFESSATNGVGVR